MNNGCTDHDVDKIAVYIAITNVMKFEKNEAGMKKIFARENTARMNYSEKIRGKKNVQEDFYEEKK